MKACKYLPLDLITKPILTTNEAAHYLNRTAHTLRVWACKKKGALQPVNIKRRLGWKTDEVKKLLGV